MLFAETDAGFKNGRSTHSYIIRNKQGRKIFQRSFYHFEERSVEAEIHSIVKLLQKISELGYSKVEIRTDCKAIVTAVNSGRSSKNVDVDYLLFLLKTNSCTLVHVPRNQNKDCDTNCRDVFKLSNMTNARLGVRKRKTRYKHCK